MIRFVIKSIWTLMVLSFVGYVVFFVPLGERTLYEHASRIAQTDEAQELGAEVSEAGERAATEVARRVAEGAQR